MSRPHFPPLAQIFPSLYQKWYVRCKVAMDPLYSAVLAALAPTAQPLLDIGCGMGVLAFYLKTHGWAPAIHGTDFDAAKIATAQQIAARHFPDCTFSTRNAADGIPPHLGSVCLLDVLQYVTTAQRPVLLQACVDRVADGGLLVVRSVLQDNNWRSRASRWMDRIATWTRWIPTPALSHPSREEITSVLTAAGMEGQFTPLWGRMPLNNWLGVFRRAHAGPPTPSE